jgi:polyisoprenyl-phosphate glycosyltransferase
MGRCWPGSSPASAVRRSSAAACSPGDGHHRLLSALIGLPTDAGAFLAMDARLRAAVFTGATDHATPSVVAAAAPPGCR